jgi:hypothetical protein
LRRSQQVLPPPFGGGPIPLEKGLVGGLGELVAHEVFDVRDDLGQ